MEYVIFGVILFFIFLALIIVLANKRSALQFLLFGIGLILVGIALLQMHWSTPVFFFPYLVVLSGLINLIVGLIKKI